MVKILTLEISNNYNFYIGEYPQRNAVQSFIFDSLE